LGRGSEAGSRQLKHTSVSQQEDALTRSRAIRIWLARTRDDASRIVLLIWVVALVVCIATTILVGGYPEGLGELAGRLFAAAWATSVVAAPVVMVIAAMAARLFSLDEQSFVVFLAPGLLIGGIGYWISLLWLSERAASWRTYGALLLLAVCSLSSAVLLPFVAGWVAAF